MKCLTPDCTCEKHHARGLCYRCYKRLQKQINHGKTTWSELVNQGLARKSHHVGPPPAERRESFFRGRVEKSEEVNRLTKVYDQAARKYLTRGYVVSPGDMTDELMTKYLDCQIGKDLITREQAEEARSNVNDI